MIADTVLCGLWQGALEGILRILYDPFGNEALLPTAFLVAKHIIVWLSPDGKPAGYVFRYYILTAASAFSMIISRSRTYFESHDGPQY